MLKQISPLDFSSTADQIKAETMLFSASPQFALFNGGYLTRTAVSLLMNRLDAFEDNSAVVIDTRVHMLMPGMFPAIGGWHCDAIPRGADGQPDFTRTSIIDNIRHYLLVVDAGTGSMTEFLDVQPSYTKSLESLQVPAGKTVWGYHSEMIEASLEGDRRNVKTVESGKLYEFGAKDYHRAIPATGSGWRYFFRASVNTLNSPKNEIRNQVQVYLPSEHLGW
jgi:hypothetical protein